MITQITEECRICDRLGDMEESGAKDSEYDVQWAERRYWRDILGHKTSSRTVARELWPAESGRDLSCVNRKTWLTCPLTPYIYTSWLNSHLYIYTFFFKVDWRLRVMVAGSSVDVKFAWHTQNLGLDLQLKKILVWCHKPVILELER